MANFIHLHVHSDFSLLDGACSVSQLVDQAFRFDMPALALTDHGNLFGAVDFYVKAQKRGIKPIIGCEVYIAPGSRFTKRRIRGEISAYHLTLLVKNREGYQNLMELVTAGFIDGFYYHPRIDKEILSQKKAGLIVLSGCLKGEISSLILQGREDEAKKAALFYRDLFTDDFYLEVQDAGIPDQDKANRAVIELSEDLSIPLVATNDVHYLTRDDAKAQEVLICIQTGKVLTDSSRLRFSTTELYFRSPEEMEKVFPYLPDALRRTEEIASKCNFSLKREKVHLPVYETPDGIDLDSFLEKLCQEGLSQHYQEVTSEIRDRLKKELSVIRQAGYSGYFLIVRDFINYAKSRGILVGPGRGSVTGCLVAYLIGITQVDPLPYGLLFERFLNLERTVMPDIDIDIQDERREEVIRYVRQKYGEDSVAQIITFGTMAARAAIRDVGRVQGIPYGKVDKIAKLIPFNTPLKIAIKEVREIRDLLAQDEQVRNLFEIARRIEGLTRHASTHAAGVVITPEKLTHFTPLYRTNKNEITTQYEMHSLETIGLLKMDFLGLKTLNVIKHTLRIIKETRGEKIELDKLRLDDQKTYRLLNRAETLGVFQVESRGMQDLLKRLCPGIFEDIIAILALYRPGPLHSRMVDDFIDGKRGRSSVKYLHPLLEPILKETYGVILYQEQVMKIANVMAGFSLGEADVLRRAMGKKNPQLMSQQRTKFVEGAIKKGVTSATAEKVFELMAYFAGYGFNKSHSAGYALICYQTAYFKANYPLEFMAALLTSEKENTDKLVEYVNECRRMGIKVLLPDINRSGIDFAVVGNQISFGLSAIKNVGQTVVSLIVKERKRKGSFKSIFDFCRRVDLKAVNKRVVESLIKCGAFDSLPGSRSQNLAVMEEAIETSIRIHRDREKGQLSLLENLERNSDDVSEDRFPDIKEVPRKRRFSWEKELLGIYLSGHPLEKYKKRITYYSSSSIANLKKVKGQRKVRVMGMINSLVLKNDRRAKRMAFVTLEDLENEVELIVFSGVYQSCSSYLEEGNLILVKGKVDNSTDSAKVIADEIIPFSQVKEQAHSLHIRIPVEDSPTVDLPKLRDILSANKGKSRVYFHIEPQNGLPIIIRSKSIQVNFSDSLIADLEELLRGGSFWLGEN